MRSVRFVFGLIVLVLCVVMIAIAELTARMIGLGDPLLYRESVTVGYSLRPNQSKTRRRGAVVTIDSQGLRSLRDWSDPADLRILFIGDSITYGGSYIDDSELFSEQVCRNLRDHGVSNITCGNAGTNAYGTDNMRARLRYSSFDNEDLIVVTIIAHDAVRGMASLSGKPFFSQELPGPVPALTEAVAFVLDEVRSRIRFEPSGTRAYLGDDLDVARESLGNLLEILADKQRRGKGILLVYSPARSELEGESNELQELVIRNFRDSNMPFIDMRMALHHEDLDKVYYDRAHLDVYGHELYGREIARGVQELADGFQVSPALQEHSRPGSRE